MDFLNRGVSCACKTFLTLTSDHQQTFPDRPILYWGHFGTIGIHEAPLAAVLNLDLLLPRGVDVNKENHNNSFYNLLYGIVGLATIWAAV